MLIQLCLLCFKYRILLCRLHTFAYILRGFKSSGLTHRRVLTVPRLSPYAPYRVTAVTAVPLDQHLYGLRIPFFFIELSLESFRDGTLLSSIHCPCMNLSLYYYLHARTRLFPRTANPVSALMPRSDSPGCRLRLVGVPGSFIS
jgi:hypothetical protein